MTAVSLRARVLLGTVLIGLVLVGTAVVITRTTRTNLVRQVDEQLLDVASGPLRRFRFDPQGPGPGPGQGGGPPRLSSVYVGYLGAGGVIRTFSAPNLTGEELPVPDLSPREVAELAATGETVTAGSQDSDLRYRLRAGVEARSGGVFVVALPLDAVDDAVARLITVEVVATLVIMAVLLAVAWWVVHLGVRPVQRMTAVAVAIADGDLSARVPDADPRTEAGELGVALNRMLDERTRSEERLRRFVADASHELRTPVATIRGYAELYRSGGLDAKAELDDAMRRTEQEAVRMADLVDDLLHLARLDQGRPLDVTAVDLAALAEDAVGDALAVEPGRPIALDAADRPIVSADEARLRQVVANLVTNARVHTPDGTPIAVAVRTEGVRGVLEVSDEGPGMSTEVAARVFERFYRADASRSRHRGGSGLGLAIVQSTVEALGGEVALDTAPGRGTRVTVSLPIRTAG